MIQYAMAMKNFDEILVSPCYKHPFKKLLPYNNRLEMCKILARELLPKKVLVINYERNLNSERTYDLLKYLTEDYPENQYTLVLGEDLKDEFKNKWYRSDDIKSMVDIMWVPIQLYSSNPVLQVRSSYIRYLLNEGEDVSHMVPKQILEYLNELNLIEDLKETGGK